MGERSPAVGMAVTIGGVAVIATIALMLLGGQVSRSLGPAPRTYYEMGADWDVACTTTTPNGDPGGCSTPLPSLEPAAVAAAVPLDVAALDVPITTTGPLEIHLGDATLANGVLREASFRVDGIEPGVQVLPPGLQIAGAIRMEVRPADPSRPPFNNGYAHGWHPGVEAVNAYLVLDVTSVDPGFVLRIRDIVVR